MASGDSSTSPSKVAIVAIARGGAATRGGRVGVQ